MCEGCNRRRFIQGAAAGGALLALHSTGRTILAGKQDDWPTPTPVKIYKLYAGRTGDDYLTQTPAEFAKLEKYFSALEKKLGDVKFIGGDTIPPASAEQVGSKLADADGLLIVHLSGHGGDAPALTKTVDAGLPTVLFSQPYSGHGWLDFPGWHKQGKKVILLPTSDLTELDRAITLLRVPARMKQTRIIVVDGHPQGTAAACRAEEVKKRFGAELVSVPNERILAAMKDIDPKYAEAEAESYWINPAKRIVEPTRPEIVESARMFLAIRELMIEEKAQAICSVCCMGDPRGCLTFSKLNDLGMVGACEGDVDSTLTMLLFNYAFGVPGFISDPVIDTARNAMLHFHCTSATKMDGPAGKRLPFGLRTQSDKRAGVALEVTHRVGQPVTCAKLVNLETLLINTGKITETSTNPLACRTQFAQSVSDARRLFLNWGADAFQKPNRMTLLHRVVFYGDYLRPAQDLCDLMGLKLLEEGGV
jgi:hypothetical protein